MIQIQSKDVQMNSEAFNTEDARAALDGIADMRRELALKATDCPFWRHGVFAAITAVLVLASGLELLPQAVLSIAGLAGVAWVAADDRRRYGMFINGYRKGRTLPITIALLAAMLGAVAFEYNARSTGLSLTVKLGIAAIAFLVALEASYAWNRAYRRELLESAG
ncbi:FtsH-binding integral membrane protein [Sphingomonas sp. BE270]|jgi:hypothetical protein|uniref:hypothetical protein n=1 Tax=Sphingomonas sp. BE270 TaxID=2817726 RepID=UPI00285CA116|nr:hypothetical protein [Sphingomonas sp. BE270]MDR7256323.1 FtsH-binding integral membrane protein [Sphingomonas sp. BE270]